MEPCVVKVALTQEACRSGAESFREIRGGVVGGAAHP